VSAGVVVVVVSVVLVEIVEEVVDMILTGIVLQPSYVRVHPR